MPKTFDKSIQLRRLTPALKASHPAWFEQVVQWAEHKWGYLRRVKGETQEAAFERRRNLLDKYINDENNFFFLVMHKFKAKVPGTNRFIELDEPRGMICLHSNQGANPYALSHVYLQDGARTNGLGSKIIEIVKNYAEKKGAIKIDFEILTPGLAKFYKKSGAYGAYECRYLDAPAEAMAIDLAKPSNQTETEEKQTLAKPKRQRSYSFCHFSRHDSNVEDSIKSGSMLGIVPKITL